MSDSILLSEEGSIKKDEERLAPLRLTATKTCIDLKRPICRKEKNARGVTSSASLHSKRATKEE